MSEVPAGLAAALADRYRVERELGGGGMSRVWVATEAALDRQVVIKVIAEELAQGMSAERFTREVRFAARLQHANIVPVLSAGTADGLPYYTMPFVRGESLRARLASGTPLGLAECVNILRDVARALAYAHVEGVVHRDIKPENVLLSHGAAMVADFGIAKALTASRTQDGGGAVTLTQAGGSIGTPAYMAPEQAVGESIDHRADLYAWGLLGYELLAGSHPFSRHITPQQLVTAHLTERPADLAARNPAVPPTLAGLVMQCLEKDPTRRPESAAVLLTALDTVATPAPTAPRPAPKSSRSRRRDLILAALVVAAAIIVWAVASRRGTGTGTGIADRSLAVLPLTNLSGDKSDDFFGIGLAEEMTRALAKNGVRVIGRTSAAALQARGLDERAVARELGVTSLLTGTVQRAGGQVRINVSLLDAADGSVRWTEKYDRPLANVFAVQDEIARTVATTLLGTLGRAPAANARAETADPEAHAMLLQGMVLFNRRGSSNLHQAIGLFEAAAARDPKYARAQAALAMALAVLPAYVQDSATPAATSAIAAAQRAIAMDSTIAESYTALGFAYMVLGELGRSENSFRRAVALDSTVATAWGWYGLLANRLGDSPAAHGRVARARALEPASLIARLWEVQVLEVDRRLAAADSAAGAAMALDSTFMLAWDERANALLGMGRTAPAIALLERRVALIPAGRPEEPHAILAYAYALAGRAGEARALLDTMRARSGGRLLPSGAVAAALEELGAHEAAVTMLTEAIARHDSWLVNFSRTVRFDRLRKDPRVGAMLARLETK